MPVYSMKISAASDEEQMSLAKQLPSEIQGSEREVEIVGDSEDNDDVTEEEIEVEIEVESEDSEDTVQEKTLLRR